MIEVLRKEMTTLFRGATLCTAAMAACLLSSAILQITQGLGHDTVSAAL